MIVETRQKLVKEKIFGSFLEKMLTFGHIRLQIEWETYIMLTIMMITWKLC